jgi:benzodiazapine receptor
MLAALLILVVMVATAALFTPAPAQQLWFLRQRRPRWLLFEKRIPLIELCIDLALALSAMEAWRSSTSWALLAAYWALWLVVQARTWLICSTRRLRYGSWCALSAGIASAALMTAVLPQSLIAALLLLPLLLWSPLDLVISREMERLYR